MKQATMIVQELHHIQEHHGYLPESELRALAQRISVPLYRLHEVASFFPHYRLAPPPAVTVKVCRDMSCHLRGACRLHRSLEAVAHEIGGGRVDVAGVSCLGQCDQAPAVSINDQVYRGLFEVELKSLVQAAAARETLRPQRADSVPRGWKIDPYNGQPCGADGQLRYDAVRKFVQSRDVDAILGALKAADLRGMGGAGFRTHLKWTAVRDAVDAESPQNPRKYVVCNADESEPGTFKDRELMRRTPYLLVEGVVLAGLLTGAKEGYVYIRHEFHEEIAAMREAIRQAREAKICGDNILGSELSFKLDVFVSPGGYICGEESALLEAMEDRRAEPRNKPPFPVHSGLYGKPTVINNVETLSWVPAIVVRGGEWYRDQGTNGATGLRFVSISGDVERPGVYEVPFGLTVREVIFDIAGGMRDGQKLKAIGSSGPSSGYLPAQIRVENLPPAFRDKLPPGTRTYDVLNLPLDLTNVPAIGSMLGAAFVVVGDRACMVDMALNTTQFFRNESCGKCVPCRLGSQKLAGMLDDLSRGRLPRQQLDLVGELTQTMELTSICGLGQVATNPMKTLLKHFSDEVNEHLERNRCPAGVCFARNGALA